MVACVSFAADLFEFNSDVFTINDNDPMIEPIVLSIPECSMGQNVLPCAASELYHISIH